MEPAPAELAFVVFSAPVAQPRQRHGVRVTGAGEARSINYTDTKHRIHEFKHAVRTAARETLGDRLPLSGPLHLGLSFIFQRPANLCRKKDPPGRLPCPKKIGDVDNLAKSVMDACNELLYADDSQITSLYVTKEYGNVREQPHVVVLIQQIGPA